MANLEYIVALDKAMSDLDSRLLKRDILNTEITGLKDTVRVLSSRVQLTEDKQRQVAQLLAMADFATPTLKDSITSVLIRTSGLTAVEVRNALEESGFNFDDFSNPLSACHAALKRLVTDEEVEPGTPKDGKTTYKIKLRLIAPPRVATLRSLATLTGLERDTANTSLTPHHRKGKGKKPGRIPTTSIAGQSHMKGAGHEPQPTTSKNKID